MNFRILHPARFTVLAILVALILTKIVWVQCCYRDIGTFESEKEDILERRAYVAIVGEAIMLAMRTNVKS